MAAPALIGSVYEASFSAANPWTITITNGFTAGNTIVVFIAEAQSTLRTFSIGSDGTNTNYSVARLTSSATTAHAMILKAENIAAVAAGATLTITLSGNCSGRMLVQELGPCAEDAARRDGDFSSTSTLTPKCGVTNDTTQNNSIIVCAGCTNGTGTLTAGTGYTKLGASVVNAHFQYRRDAVGATTNNGPFNSSIARGYAGALTAFVVVAAATSLAPSLRMMRPQFYRRRRP